MHGLPDYGKAALEQGVDAIAADVFSLGMTVTLGIVSSAGHLLQGNCWQAPGDLVGVGMQRGAG
jgi:hypothetical protein